MAEPIVALEGVRYVYEDFAMAFELAVPAGQFLTLFGPSGAGKTTLLNLIAGFEPPAGGRIRLAGRDMTRAPPADRPVTMLFQEHNLFPHLTAADNVGLGMHPGLRLGTADRARVSEALSQVGLARFEARLPGQLSGGERQRVALARALVRRRPILLLDEPFAALGPAQRREMLRLVDGLRADRGMTVLMVSHQLDEIRHVADRAAFVHRGRILADGPMQAMLERPDPPEIGDYLVR